MKLFLKIEIDGKISNSFYKVTITLIPKPHINLAKIRVLNLYKVIYFMNTDSINFNHCSNVICILF